jgi:hypothetical protein
MPRPRIRFGLPLIAMLLFATPAFAEDVPDIGKLADFIRWGGVLLSALVIAAAVVLLRIVSGLAARLGARFASRRLLVQKLESVVHFAAYLATAGICVGLSVRPLRP